MFSVYVPLSEYSWSLVTPGVVIISMPLVGDVGEGTSVLDGPISQSGDKVIMDDPLNGW